MLNTYCISKPIDANRIFNGCLRSYGISEIVDSYTTESERTLIDSDGNTVNVIIDDDDSVYSLQASEESLNSPWMILSAISVEFNCDINSVR